MKTLCTVFIAGSWHRPAKVWSDWGFRCRCSYDQRRVLALTLRTEQGTPGLSPFGDSVRVTFHRSVRKQPCPENAVHLLEPST